jgi:hypothetical protein
VKPCGPTESRGSDAKHQSGGSEKLAHSLDENPSDK